MRPAIIVVDMLKDAFRKKDLPAAQEYLRIVPEIKKQAKKSKKDKSGWSTSNPFKVLV